MSSRTDEGTPQTPRALIDRIEGSWQAWVNAVDGIPDDRLVESSVGHWSTKDLLGHVAFWEDWVIGECQRIQAGAPDPGGDMDPINEGQVAESKRASAAAQKQYRDEAHARLSTYLATIADGEPNFPKLVDALAGETWEHYDEHTAQVLAWRAMRGL